MLHVPVGCWCSYLGSGRRENRPRHSTHSASASPGQQPNGICDKRRTDELPWDFIIVAVGLNCPYICYSERGCSCRMSRCPVGCPDIFEQGQFEEHPAAEQRAALKRDRETRISNKASDTW